GDFKGLRRRVNRVVFSIDQGYFDVYQRVARDEAALERLAHAFFDAWDELVRNDAAHDFVFKNESFFAAHRQRLDLQPHITKLAVTAALSLMATVSAGLLANGFAVRDALIACFQVNPVFAFDALERDLQVGLSD